MELPRLTPLAADEIAHEVAAEIDAMLLRLPPMPTFGLPESCGHEWTTRVDGLEVPFRCTLAPHDDGHHESLGLDGQLIARDPVADPDDTEDRDQSDSPDASP